MTQRTDTASEIKSLGEELSHLSAFVDKALTGLLRFMQKGDPSDVMPDEGKRESIQDLCAEPQRLGEDLHLDRRDGLPA